MLLQAVNHSFQTLWWRDHELALAGSRPHSSCKTLILLSSLSAPSCSGTLSHKIVSTCLTYWFSQRFFSLLVAVYVFRCLSFELNLVNHLKTLLNLFLVFFCSIFCHEVTDVDKNVSVNSRVISSKYTHVHSIHVYSRILKSEVVLSVPLIVSVLLIFFEARQVYAWNKISHFLGDAEHVKLMIQRWLAVVGVCVVLGDADTCTVGPWDCVRGSWTGKLTALTRWLQTWETPQGMVYLA